MEAAADLGLVTLGGDPAGVYLGGRTALGGGMRPGGYQWRPRTGDKVLVVQGGGPAGDPMSGRSAPAGDPGEGGASGGRSGADHRGQRADGSEREGAWCWTERRTAVKGRVTVNGERLEDLVRRIAADVVSSMLG